MKVHILNFIIAVFYSHGIFHRINIVAIFNEA